jgi:hypothetical protein
MSDLDRADRGTCTVVIGESGIRLFGTFGVARRREVVREPCKTRDADAAPERTSQRQAASRFGRGAS